MKASAGIYKEALCAGGEGEFDAAARKKGPGRFARVDRWERGVDAFTEIGCDSGAVGMDWRGS